MKGLLCGRGLVEAFVRFCFGLVNAGLELHEGQTLASCHRALLKAWLLRGLES